MDIGTLSEQLRAAKRECATWKARAEAAEKRVSALERFTRKLRGIKGGDAQNDASRASQSERSSIGTMGTEDGEVVTERIKRAMKGLDGPRSSDGGAAAWWDDGRAGAVWGGQSIAHDAQSPLVLTETALLEVWEAAQELLADDEI
ncbi:RhoGAP domain-containing protein [Colletotrichum higginsianum IMI 349063]|uniref:RhoGAP domain-containing protein n=1 Tax=Colletotrichum higginsianum (strain IMI 349063) TaxID=759273 RepID=A0A1B7YFS7_COLHI|nr:RhoGAP domain-containing protein [Colletotrichum higginsianum IMI 349063]OBR10943.1 RhoGAP domain-containing protein [Colletotrichum higginsianum IMI 349063]